MPIYNSNPSTNTPVQMLLSRWPGYAFGSKATNQPTTKMSVTSVAVSSNVVTLGVSVVEGSIPVAGSLITVFGTTTDSGVANVTNVALASVSINSITGVGTVTYAASGSNQSTTPDVGLAFVPVPEVAEACSVKKSQAFAVTNYGISWAYTCPSAPATIAIQLEGAINDNDSEYTIIGSSQTTTTGYNEVFATVPELVQFVRVNITATSGGSSPTIIAKVLNS